ncbi:MAG: alpha/beta hydrolase [Bacteroidetes bacterium]|nr:alpha/beta hydrolase [Bacteroidota bacterium]MBU1116972.1 alpha/beta hydrolase [Bacteroidota bacterium]MBU1799039.1 alpha/beta hydrolase [Bacteroidota bacterium]
MKANNKCNLSGIDISYIREGSGEHVLLIHGITTYSFIWRKIISLLSPNYDVIAVDLIGCGSSDKPLDIDYSIKNQAKFIVEFIKKLELGKVHLVAHDIGGGIAQILAANNPELFYDVTLINSVAYDFWPVQPIIAMRTPIIRQLAMATLDFGTFRLIVKRGLFHKEVLTDELMDLFWEPLKTRNGRKAFLHLAECLNNKQLLEISDKLHNLEIPVLIIHGEADVYLSADISKTLHNNIHGSKLLKISTAGHFMMEDEPDQIARGIVQFFKGVLNA